METRLESPGPLHTENPLEGIQSKEEEAKMPSSRRSSVSSINMPEVFVTKAAPAPAQTEENVEAQANPPDDKEHLTVAKIMTLLPVSWPDEFSLYASQSLLF